MLAGMKSTILERIEKAARSGDSRKVQLSTSHLSKVEELLHREKALERDVAALAATMNAPSGPPVVDPAPHADSTRTPSRQSRADNKEVRERIDGFLSGQGFLLTPVKGQLYRNHKGQIVGVPISNEHKPNRWFLGLPTGKFDAAALVCIAVDGSITTICLPPEFFEKHGRHLSESGGQAKFNVRSVRGKLVMPLPGRGSVSVSEYVNRYDLVS